MSLLTVALIALAGGLGAVLRYLVDSGIRSRIRTRLPIAILVVNATGSLALGAVVGMIGTGVLAGSYYPALGIGFLGGYTTFSTTTVDTVRLFRERRPGLALLNSLGGLVLCIGCAAAGGLIALWCAP